MSKNFPYNVMRHRDWDKAPRVAGILATGMPFPAAMAAGQEFRLSLAVCCDIHLLLPP